MTPTIFILFILIFKSRSEISWPEDISKEGKQHYDIINEKAKLPKYGSCWRNAVTQLNIGCKYLNENMQGKLALGLTDCFMQSSGYESINCNNKFCVQNLSDRAFNAYTEFYTHTHSMCYYLKSEIWHEETEKVIDKLSSTSEQVAKQLEETEKGQVLLLERQKESIIVQDKLFSKTKNVSSMLTASQGQIVSLMNDFQTATKEQRDMLFDIFDHLSSFKSWVIGEVSWIDTMIFYIVAGILINLFTSIPRTQSVRLFLLFFLCAYGIFERYACLYLIDTFINMNNSMYHLSEYLNYWVWTGRECFALMSLIILITTAYFYQDYSILNNLVLQRIEKQNKMLIEQVQELKNMLEKVLKMNKMEIESEFKSPDSSIIIIPDNRLTPIIEEPDSPNFDNSVLQHPVLDRLDSIERSPSRASSRGSEFSETSSVSRYNLRHSIRAVKMKS